eukprot:s3185_g1.t1
MNEAWNNLTNWYAGDRQLERLGAPSEYTDQSDVGEDDDCCDMNLPDYVAKNPVPFQLAAVLLTVAGMVLIHLGSSGAALRTLAVAREATGFCCWRQHPSPYFGGDPCTCPPEHRGDFTCPPEGCTDGTAIWKRGPGTESNSKAYCHQFVEVAS